MRRRRILRERPHKETWGDDPAHLRTEPSPRLIFVVFVNRLGKWPACGEKPFFRVHLPVHDNSAHPDTYQYWLASLLCFCAPKGRILLTNPEGIVSYSRRPRGRTADSLNRSAGLACAPSGTATVGVYRWQTLYVARLLLLERCSRTMYWFATSVLEVYVSFLILIKRL